MSVSDVEALIADLLQDAAISKENSVILEGLQSYFNELREARATLEEKNAELAALNENVARLQADNTNLSDESAEQILQLEENLNSFKKLAADRLSRIESFEATHEGLEANVAELKKKLTSASNKLTDYGKFMPKLKELEEENKNLRKSIAYIIENARSAHNTLEESHSRMAKKLKKLRAKA